MKISNQGWFPLCPQAGRSCAQVAPSRVLRQALRGLRTDTTSPHSATWLFNENK